MQTNIFIEEVKVEKPSLFGIIWSPAAQFERMRETTYIALPLIILLILTAITGAITTYVSLSNPIIKNSEAMTMMADLDVPPAFTAGMGAAGALFGGLVVYLLLAAFYKICLILIGNDTTYRKLLGVVIFSSLISTLGLLVNGGIAVASGGFDLTYTSLAPIVSNNTLHAVAAYVDVFNIWSYLVMGLGLNIVAGLSKNKAIILVVIVFLIGAGFSSVGALIQP